MKLPRLNHPERYTGLYIYDFGQHVAVGYTAEEVRMLQDSAEHGAGTAYLIYRADPGGQLLLRGIDHLGIPVPEALVFYHSTLEAAAEDYAVLQDLARNHAPPCVLHWYRAIVSEAEWSHCAVLVYEAHATEVVGRWLNAVGFAGGEFVEADTSMARRVATPGGAEEHIAIAPDPRYHARPRDQVLARVHDAIQRFL